MIKILKNRIPKVIIVTRFFILAALVVSCQSSGLDPRYGAAYFPRANSAAIALVHGFAGFGRDEALGFRYWGGYTADIQEKLRDAGYATVTPAIGPISSNWDRACELYAALKGGRVDYGQAHSSRYNHARFGRTYPGLLTNWGTKDRVTGITQKIHIIGHSMGGQTAKLLTALLANGSKEEKEASGDAVSPLFAGSHNWIISVMTINSPHDGISQIDHFESSELKKQLSELIAISSMGLESIYDFKLDQWELQPGQGESVRDFSNRVFADRRWQDSLDSSYFDLSPEGSSVLNQKAPAVPGVYYFSWAADTTEKGPGNTRVPAFWTNMFLKESAAFIGSLEKHETGMIEIDQAWWPNDGVVNTRSQLGPTLGTTDRIVEWIPGSGKSPNPGVWNLLGIMENTDHVDLIGISSPLSYNPSGFPGLVEFYVWNAALLSSLREIK